MDDLMAVHPEQSLVKRLYVASWVPFAKTKDKFFFTANDFNTTAGYELWASDGSSQGTKMVKDILYRRL